jgi:hypothetical protein
MKTTEAMREQRRKLERRELLEYLLQRPMSDEEFEEEDQQTRAARAREYESQPRLVRTYDAVSSKLYDTRQWLAGKIAGPA